MYPMKEAEIEESKYFEQKNYPSGYPNIQKLRLYLVSNLNEKYIYFLPYLVFFCFFLKGPNIKDQEVKGQVSTHFFRGPFNVI